MPFSDFRLMALFLGLMAACSLAVTLRTFGFFRWCGPAVRKAARKCKAALKRKPKPAKTGYAMYDHDWVFEYPAGKPLDKPAPHKVNETLDEARKGKKKGKKS